MKLPSADNLIFDQLIYLRGRLYDHPYLARYNLQVLYVPMIEQSSNGKIIVGAAFNLN